MALTQDQSASLQTAIENLNQSVEVNKQVLEVVKSVGNTGVVDIATHNNDPDAHPYFNSTLIKNSAFIGSKTFNETDKSAISLNALKTGNANEYGNGVIDIYNRNDLSSQKGYGSIRFNNRNVNTQNGTVILGGFSSRTYVDSGIATTHSFNFQQDSDGKFYILLGVKINGNPQSTESQQVYIREGRITANHAPDLGHSAFQFKDLYLQNSPIVSSDRRLKQDFSSVPEAVFKAWANVNFQVYKFKEAVAKKGEAAARKHVGLVAQDIIEAFEAQGLSAFDYGIVCHDEWDDQYYDEQIIDAEAVLDAEGKVPVPEKSHMEHRLLKTAGDVYTVRYEEALALEAAYQRWRLKKIEEALAAKGITL